MIYNIHISYSVIFQVLSHHYIINTSFKCYRIISYPIRRHYFSIILSLNIKQITFALSFPDVHPLPNFLPTSCKIDCCWIFRCVFSFYFILWYSFFYLFPLIYDISLDCVNAKDALGAYISADVPRHFSQNVQNCWFVSDKIL